MIKPSSVWHTQVDGDPVGAGHTLSLAIVRDTRAQPSSAKSVAWTDILTGMDGNDLQVNIVWRKNANP